MVKLDTEKTRSYGAIQTLVEKHGPGYASPMAAMQTGPREKLLYCPAIYTGTGIEKPDYLATIDVDESSATFCQVINRVNLGIGDELHHFGWDACSSCYCDSNKRRRHLIVPSFTSGNIYVLSTEKDEKAPKLIKTIAGTELASKFDLANPHTSHCLGDGNVMIGCLARADGSGRGEFLLLDSTKNFDYAQPNALWSKDGIGAPNGYDFWYQPRHNVMISSEFAAPKVYSKGFDPSLIAKEYGHRLYVWDWSDHSLKQTIELKDTDGLIPLEIRFAHDPAKDYAFVGCTLSSTIHMIHPDEENPGKWTTTKIIKVDPVECEGWALPAAPGFIPDLVLSLDDKYLYFGNWLQGDVRQYDVSDPKNPKLTGQVFVGGIFQEGTPFKPIGKFERHRNPAPTGVKLQGGPQMLQLSLDGKRLYITNSLYSVWDKQFYPDMVKKGSQLIRLNADVENGGLALDMNFCVDFGKEPNGPALAHEIRYPGGDCTSDIWI